MVQTASAPMELRSHWFRLRLPSLNRASIGSDAVCPNRTAVLLGQTHMLPRPKIPTSESYRGALTTHSETEIKNSKGTPATLQRARPHPRRRRAFGCFSAPLRHDEHHRDEPPRTRTSANRSRQRQFTRLAHHTHPCGDALLRETPNA